MGVLTASAVYYYIVIPKDRSEEPDKNIIIKSESVCDLMFIQKMLRFEADIIVGHNNWKLDSDEVLDVVEICRKQTYVQNGKNAFNEILKSFKIKLGLTWGSYMPVRTFRSYYKDYYEEYYNKLSNKQKVERDIPKAIFYNAFAKTVNEYINIQKTHGNIILRPM